MATSVSTTTIWEVDSATGADTNGGGFDSAVSGGVDYTQGAGQKTVIFDGATIAASTSGVSATITINGGYTVLAGDAGNVVQISGGTNFTAGFYLIDSVSTGANTWTLHANCCTGAGSGMTGRAGGAFASPGGLGAAVTTAAGSTSTDAYIKYSATAYAMGTSSNTANGRLTWNGHMLCGYNTTRSLFNTDALRPIFNPSANAVTLFTPGTTNQIYCNLDCENPAAKTTCNGFNVASGTTYYNIKISDFNNGIFNGNSLMSIVNCTIVNAGNQGIQIGNMCLVMGCTLINCKTPLAAGGATNGTIVVDTIVAGNNGTGHGISAVMACVNCIVYGLTGTTNHGYNACSYHINCIAASIAGSGSTYGFASASNFQSLTNCSGWSNTIDYNTSNFTADRISNFIALSANPFVSPGTTSAANFGLNSTAGGGALLKALAIPAGSFPGLASTVNARDIGAAQHADPAVVAGGGSKLAGNGGGLAG